MNNLVERTTTSVVGNGMAVTRALAKARVGDGLALRWLIDQGNVGNVAAARAIEELQRAHGAEVAHAIKAGEAFAV